MEWTLKILVDPEIVFYLREFEDIYLTTPGKYLGCRGLEYCLSRWDAKQLEIIVFQFWRHCISQITICLSCLVLVERSVVRVFVFPSVRSVTRFIIVLDRFLDFPPLTGVRIIDDPNLKRFVHLIEESGLSTTSCNNDLSRSAQHLRAAFGILLINWPLKIGWATGLWNVSLLWSRDKLNLCCLRKRHQQWNQV